MPTLLDLPRELRVEILRLVIAAPSPAPPDPSVAGNRTELHDVKYGSEGNGKNVMYVQGWNRTDSIPTLLVNRQLHAETLAVLDKLPTRHSYALDVVLAHEKALYPTWLSVPALTNRVDKVHVAFRIVGVWTGPALFAGFMGGDGGPPRIVWCFYSLLERFLRVGPVGHQEKDVDRGVSVKILELDIRTPNVPEDLLAPKGMEDYDDLDELRKQTGVDYIMRPEYLLEFIAGNIETLLSMWGDAGDILYERLGRIMLMLDGEVHKEWDLARTLADIHFHDSFVEWKANLYKTRIQLGLPVFPDNLSSKVFLCGEYRGRQR